MLYKHMSALRRLRRLLSFPYTQQEAVTTNQSLVQRCWYTGVSSQTVSKTSTKWAALWQDIVADLKAPLVSPLRPALRWSGTAESNETVSPPRSARPVQADDLQRANQELEDFFGDRYLQPMHEMQLANELHSEASPVEAFAGESESSSVDVMHQEDGLRIERTPGRTSLTHVDSEGRASMVGVGEKRQTIRKAKAVGRVVLGKDTFQLVAANKLKKGDVLPVAQLAGIMAAKQTSNLIPLCHNIPLSKVDVDLRLDPEAHTVNVAAEVECVGQTGVEMEALTAVSVAALAVYDMCKASSHEIVIDNLHLELKSGGQRGYYRASTPTTNINQRVGGGPTMQ